MADGNVGPTLARATEQIIEEEDGGMHDQHMEVVNGWCASIASLCCSVLDVRI